MEAGSHLASLLQFQLASDASAARYLPYCLSTLSSECLAPSSHRSKWASRINSLLHSKEASARWSGLCLANKSALLSQSLMIERAQSWLSVVIPMFTKSEPLPVLKAAVRLIVTIFTTATDIAEFHRQVCVPNAVKITSSLLPLASQFSDTELKVTVITSLARLIRQYPTAHRASSAHFMSFALEYLNGSPITQSNHEVVHAAAELYSTLPLIGGKVGGVNLWRKSIDDTLAFAWDAFFALRTTFPRQDREAVTFPQGTDPQIHVQVNIDRLRCAIVVFEHLLCARMQRPVQVPLGNLVKIIVALLSVTDDGKVDGFIDPYIRPLEVAITPEICSLGCSLIQCLCQRCPMHLDAYCSKMLTILAFQLEQCRKPALKCALLEALLAMLKVCKLPDSSALSRITQFCLRTVAEVAITTRNNKAVEPSSSSAKNGKKKASAFEGEEVFKTSAQVTCPTRETQIALLASLEVTKNLMLSGSLPPAMRSTTARVIISIMLSLPSISPSSISPDASFVYELRNRVQQVGLVIAQGTTNVMSKSLPYVLGEVAFEDNAEAQRQLETLIHPRLPPLVRSVPFLEALSLFKAEESHEEVDILSSIGLHVEHEVPGGLQNQDVSMGDAVPSRPETMSTHISPPAPPPTVELFAPTPSQKPLPSLAASTKPTEDPVKQLQQTAHRPDAVDELPSLTIGHKSLAATSVPLVKQHGSSFPISSSMKPPAVDEDEEMPGINMDSDSEDDE